MIKKEVVDVLIEEVKEDVIEVVKKDVIEVVKEVKNMEMMYMDVVYMTQKQIGMAVVGVVVCLFSLNLIYLK